MQFQSKWSGTRIPMFAGIEHCGSDSAQNRFFIINKMGSENSARRESLSEVCQKKMRGKRKEKKSKTRSQYPPADLF